MKKSVVLVITFGVMIVVLALAAGLITLMRQQPRLTESQIKRKKALFAAEAGIVDAYTGLTNRTPPYDTVDGFNPPYDFFQHSIFVTPVTETEPDETGIEVEIRIFKYETTYILDNDDLFMCPPVRAPTPQYCIKARVINN